MEPMALSFTGLIHFPRLKDRLATHFVPFAEFERDAVAGTLPDFSLIEPNMLAGHGDYHPAMGRSFSNQVELAVDNPSSTLSGEAFLERVAPTPVMMTIADEDNLCVTELQLAAYQQLREPKQLQLLRGNHYVAYEHGQPEAADAQADFLLNHLA